MSRNVAVAALLSGLVLFGSPSLRADESVVRQAFTARFPGAPIESVTRMPMGGLYEIVVAGADGPDIVYTDEKLSFLMGGRLLDLTGGKERDLTSERWRQLTARDLLKSQEGAIKRVKGNGKRVLYTFEDPNCGYCKLLQKELAKMNDLTIYTILIPILGQDSVDKSRGIWCARDRARAWDDVMLKAAAAPAARKDCEVPFENNLKLARRLGINGTPAIYLGNGERVGRGYAKAEEIERALAAPGR
jgi:thiol:disulfide interchange protein DsbC